jgi:hypothetical protein
VTRLTTEDIERLASRVAMLASEDGEADNAGRAVGQMARRLGLSGGDLKAMFLDGARHDAQGRRWSGWSASWRSCGAICAAWRRRRG